MSPKSSNSPQLISTSSPNKVSSQQYEGKIERESIFAMWVKPWGLDERYVRIIYIGISHVFTIYCLYLTLTGKLTLRIIPFELFYGYLGGLGITVGCHRYWTHKTFKATLPLQICLMIMQTISGQHTIHKWCLDHRVHHKYTDTDSDPHNSKRGFWFSHIGWLILPQHKETLQKLRTFDMSDLEKDPVVRFQSRWYPILLIVFGVIIPGSVLYYVWGLPLLHCIASNFRRHTVSNHVTFCVNSFAHIWGDKPYDKRITATNNPVVSFFTMGEGWHNYHHTFPWDYRASEFGWKFDISTKFIDFFASIGWAYDLKTVSEKTLDEKLRLHTSSLRESNLCF